MAGLVPRTLARARRVTFLTLTCLGTLLGSWLLIRYVRGGGFRWSEIGLLLCFVAWFLARETHSLIVGESASIEDRREVARLAAAVPGVRRVTQLLSMHRGPDDVLLAMKIAFSPELSVAQLEAATDAVEDAIRTKLPHMTQIFIEADSKYDGHIDARPDASVLPPEPR